MSPARVFHTNGPALPGPQYTRWGAGYVWTQGGAYDGPQYSSVWPRCGLNACPMRMSRRGVSALPTVTAKRMWYCSVGHGHPPALRAAVDSMGADRICLGSDFPYEAGELYNRAIQYISDSGLKPGDAEKILDRNAAHVLGLA